MQSDVLSIVQSVEPYKSKVSTLLIKDERSAKYASDLKEFIKTAIKKLEEARKKANEEPQQIIKKNNAEFNSFIEPLEALEKAIKVKLMVYLENERIRIAEENERKQKAIDDMAKKNGLPQIPIVEEEKRTIVSSLGKTFTRKVWSWEIIDEAKVPREYLEINVRKINAEVEGAIKTIKGVSSNDLVGKYPWLKVYQKESVV